ncbi:MAG: hypothetical protein V4717_23935 [Bacteroidota bacterium]
MDISVIVLCIIIALLIGGFTAYMLWAQKKFTQLEGDNAKKEEGLRIQIAAYERLALFAERIKLGALVNRLYDSSLSARQMQQVLLNSIREEYEHNVTQQLYIKPELWEAISKMKDQNAYIINQLAALAPGNATALDLNKKILDFNLGNPDATMNKLVLDALQFEVKQLINR